MLLSVGSEALARAPGAIRGCFLEEKEFDPRSELSLSGKECFPAAWAFSFQMLFCAGIQTQPRSLTVGLNSLSESGRWKEVAFSYQLLETRKHVFAACNPPAHLSANDCDLAFWVYVLFVHSGSLQSSA